MADIAAKMLVALIAKLMTESFLAKVLIACLDSWSKSTENTLDDRVVKAMADALDVPVQNLKP